MSDIHGCYAEYLEMLNKIGFSDEDELFILGDALDRGRDPIPLLLDLMHRTNVHFIQGNHDCIAEHILRKLYIDGAATLTSSDIKRLSNWLCEGGRPTKEQFYALEADTQKKILDFIRGSPTYAELTIQGKKFILVHGGLPNFDSEKKLCEYDKRMLTETRTDYGKPYFTDAVLVTGHTPTFLINEAYRGKIYTHGGHIAIDCGCVFGSGLGCICLDDFQEYYVQSINKG